MFWRVVLVANAATAVLEGWQHSWLKCPRGSALVGPLHYVSVEVPADLLLCYVTQATNNRSSQHAPMPCLDLLLCSLCTVHGPHVCDAAAQGACFPAGPGLVA